MSAKQRSPRNRPRHDIEGGVYIESYALKLTLAIVKNASYRLGFAALAAGGAMMTYDRPHAQVLLTLGAAMTASCIGESLDRRRREGRSATVTTEDH